MTKSTASMVADKATVAAGTVRMVVLRGRRG